VKYTKIQWSILLCGIVIFSLVNEVSGAGQPVFMGQYPSGLTRKADFSEFWEATLSQLVQWPAQVTDKGNGELQFHGQANRLCTAVFSAPPGCTVSGAILHITQRGNLSRHASWHDGYAHLCINWYPPQQDYQWEPNGLPDRQAYILGEAIVDAYRAVEVLLSRPQVAADRVGIIGEGLGGAIAIALAGLVPEKVSFVIAYDPWPAYHYPPAKLMPSAPRVASSLADYEDRFHQWRRPIHQSTSYFDIINFAPQVQAPTLIILPELAKYDRSNPTRILYNCLGGEKQLMYTPTKLRRHLVSSISQKDICHQWAQQAQRPTQYSVTQSAVEPFDKLLIPENLPVLTLDEEADEGFVTAAAVYLSR